MSEIEDELTELTIDDAKAIDPDAKLGDLVETEQLDGDVFGRIGAQTAKQVVLQRLREAERDVVFDQFASREGELITGTVNRVEPRAIILDVGKGVEAILATTEQSAAGALPDRAERQGVRARSPSLDQGSADLRQPHPQGLPEAAVRARGARDPQRHGRDQGDRPRGGQSLEGRRGLAPGRP